MPVAQYSHAHGCSITGGYVYRGSAVPAAKGRYFYGDYCSGTIWSLRLVGRCRAADQARAVHGQEPDLVRRGREPASSTPSPARARSTSSPPEASRSLRRRSRLHASTPIATPTVSISDVVPGCVPAADEVLVDLVRDGVERAGEDRDGGTLDRPQRGARRGWRTRVRCAILRRIRSQVPRPEDRLGIDENAKITAAQRTIGAHARKPLADTIR